MFSKHLEDDFGIKQEQTSEFFTGVFNECLEGRADLKTEVAPFLPKWGWDKGVDSFLEYWFKAEHVIDDRLIALIQKLRSEGHKCYVATNQERHRTNYMRNQMGFGEYFDDVYSSADLGSKKPAAAFYENLLKKIGSPELEDTWFFDDTPKNIDGAKAVGLNAELYSDFVAFKKLVIGEGWLMEKDL